MSRLVPSSRRLLPRQTALVIMLQKGPHMAMTDSLLPRSTS